MKHRIRIALFAAVLPIGLAVSTPAPVRADETPANVCVQKTTGAIRNSTEPTCLATELAIGNSAIQHGDTRPKAFNSEFANRIKAAQLLAKKKGITIRVTSGWRSQGAQAILYKKAIKKNGSVEEATKWVLPPEYSMHPWGLAADINYGSGKRSGAAWLETNGYKVGLCRRYANEWWHFEPLVAPGQPCPALEPYATIG